MRIVVLDGHILNPGDNPWTLIEQLGELTVYDSTPDKLIIERSKDADIILTNKVKLESITIKSLPNLKYIGILATGYNVVDIKAASERNIPVCNVIAYGVESVAQHVMALLFELCRSTSIHDASIRRNEWANKGWCYLLSPQIELTNLTMGIIGFGNIGQKVGEYANAFGMSVLADNYHTKHSVKYSPFEYVGRDEIFERADVISLHCPLTDKNNKMINAQAIAKMKNNVILINVARGELIDENDVANALHSGKIGGLGIDVMTEEPPKHDNVLLSTPATLITPHIAWSSLKARKNIINLTAENIKVWLNGGLKSAINEREINISDMNKNGN